jgi:hypothetical protein
MFATEQCLLVLSHHPDVWIMAAQYLDQTAKHLTEKAVCIPHRCARYHPAHVLMPESFFPVKKVSVRLTVIGNISICDILSLKICAINSSPFDDNCIIRTTNVVDFFYSKKVTSKCLMNFERNQKTSSIVSEAFTKCVLL